MDEQTRRYFYELGKAHARYDPARNAAIYRIVQQGLRKLDAKDSRQQS
jgi:hypothetical protein